MASYNRRKHVSFVNKAVRLRSAVDGEGGVKPSQTSEIVNTNNRNNQDVGISNATSSLSKQNRFRPRATSGSEVSLSVDPTQQHAAEVAGFAGWVTSFSAWITYLLWLFLPEELVIRHLGQAFYVDRYWALAVPAVVVMIVCTYAMMYSFASLAVNPPLNSLDTLCDSHTISRTATASPYVEELKRRQRCRVLALEISSSSAQSLHSSVGDTTVPSFESATPTLDDIETTNDARGSVMKSSRRSSPPLLGILRHEQPRCAADYGVDPLMRVPLAEDIPRTVVTAQLLRAARAASIQSQRNIQHQSSPND